ncbi:hypothetical protein HOLleu_13015 [Holothuria leucospilota]|uniref:SRCR domain-containing protein n=1 Tax=Holothuria leucospilota TaxID=206669 RepID=A0A9Q1CA97_HOLLE|nr:hypothetical protein HOLleu_13015 [Holothuria leucospilota]
MHLKAVKIKPMAHGCFTVVSCSWLISLILIQGHVCTSTRKEVVVKINRDGVVETTVDGEKGYCVWSSTEQNWKVMNVICRQLQKGPPQWIDQRFEYLPFPNYFYYAFGRYDRDKPSGNSRRWNTTYHNFTCKGNEKGLSACKYRPHSGRWQRENSYILAQCLPATSQDLKIYLMRTPRYQTNPEGTIVTYVNKSWGPICTNYQNLSSVVCPVFGKEVVHKPKNETHNKIQYIYADPVLIVHKCNGTEPNLSQCDIDTTMPANNSCHHASSYAYVECKRVYPPLKPKTPEGGWTEDQWLCLLGIIPLLMLCSSTICFKKAARVRKRLDDDDDSDIIDPNMTIDEARLRVVRKFF